MNKKFQSYLIKKYPDLYDKELNIECEDGWFKLIFWLSRYLTDYVKLQNECAKKFSDKYMHVDPVKVIEINERYGILKFSIKGGDMHINSIISFVEYISGFVCEKSGKTNNVGFNKIGRVKTHHKQYSKEEDFYPVDDDELRILLDDSQLEFNF